MRVKNCRVITLNVGQGLFNLVIGTKDSGRLYTAVFDCGNFPEYAVTGIEEACRILNGTGDFSMLDDVVISHQDEDHWRNFLEFLLLLNGEEYSEDVWYYLPRKYSYNYVKCAADTISEFHVDASGNFDYLLYAYSKNGMGMADGSIKNPENRQPSERKIRLFSGNFYMTFQFFPAEEEQWRITVTLCGKETGIEQVVPFDNIHNTCIEIIAGSEVSEDVKECLYDLLRAIFQNLVFGYGELCECESGARTVNIIVRDLYLGGEDCGLSYLIFKKKCALFSISYTNTGSYMCMRPDQGIKKTWTYPEFETNIKKPDLSDQGAVYKNATSMICGLYVSQTQCLLFPGDATVHVFGSLAERLDAGTTVGLLIAPHHGSSDTNFSYYFNKQTESFEQDALANQPLYRLLSRYPPEYIFISAERNKFGHPRVSFLEFCENVCRRTSEEHGILCGPNSWRSGDGFTDNDVFVSHKAVFSTESSDADLYYDFTGQKKAADDRESPRFFAEKAADTGVRETCRKLPPDGLFIPYGGYDV